jgi:hypothetical protein
MTAMDLVALYACNETPAPRILIASESRRPWESRRLPCDDGYSLSGALIEAESQRFQAIE